METTTIKRFSFKPGEKVYSITYHPPEIMSGTGMTIVSAKTVPFYAVQLPNGELHRWFADFELQPVTPGRNKVFRAGDLALVTTELGHSPKIDVGMIVKIVRVFTNTPIYDIRLDDGSYHRWLADFELIRPV